MISSRKVMLIFDYDVIIIHQCALPYQPCGNIQITWAASQLENNSKSQTMPIGHAKFALITRDIDFKQLVVPDHPDE